MVDFTICFGWIKILYSVVVGGKIFWKVFVNRQDKCFKSPDPYFKCVCVGSVCIFRQAKELHSWYELGVIIELFRKQQRN